MAVGSVLRDDIIRVAEGEMVSERLERRVRMLQDVPLDDSVGETPHASARRLELGARGSRFGWLSSSHRLRQKPHETLVPDLPVSLQFLWDEYLRVANFTSTRRFRISRKALENAFTI